MQFLNTIILGGIMVTILLYRKRLGIIRLYITIAAIIASSCATLIMSLLKSQDMILTHAYFLVLLYFLVSAFYASYSIYKERRKWQLLDERARAYRKAAAWDSHHSLDDVVVAMREELRKKRHMVTDTDIHRALRVAHYPVTQGQ